MKLGCLCRVFDTRDLSVCLGYFKENILLHFIASMISGLITTAASMPVDIAKTRFTLAFIDI